MKKLLVLMLVLGLVSAANAALSLSLNGGSAPSDVTIGLTDTLVIDVTSDTTTGYAFLLEFRNPTIRTFSNAITTQGDISAWTYYGPPTYVPPGYPYPYFSVNVSAGVPPDALVAGTGFQFDYQAGGVAGDVLIQLLDFDTSAVIDSITIHQTPEPMTIALLGLGGLFLRRRKK